MDGIRQSLPPIRDAFEHAPCGLVTTTVDGTIVRVNTTFCRWTGFDARELLDQRRIQDLLTVGGKVFHQTHWAPLLQMQGSVAEVKLEFRHGDGHKVPMLINAVRRSIADTEFDDFACVVVSDRHKYEKELVQTRRQAEEALEAKSVAEQALQLASRHKDEFLATLAHELRNPLAPIQAAVQLFAQKEFSDQQVIWSRGVLERQVTHLVRLVDDLMDISRIAEGKLELRKEHIELSGVMRQAIEGSRDLLRAESHRFTAILPDNPVYLDADPVRLIQVVQNLLNNAAKYTPAGGDIELEVRREDCEAVISVRDSGIGIAVANLETLFTIFSQLPSGRKRSQGGLGIGLSLVRAMTERHGGTVIASSPGINQGSQFTVRLPLSAVQTAAPEDDAPALPTPCDGRRILIVDDNEDTAASLAVLLQGDGYETRTAVSGQDALNLASEFLPDAFLLDISLPDISGNDLARKLRTGPRGSGLLLIALTGWSQEQDRQTALDAGFDHYLLKPVDYERMLALLR
ncbi:response regulator [Paraburkholderia sp. MMS20-SJTR3]|uniref:histidine kinase n=1 Tax=Paraburkholderia sejongensis TaxID=2886946 RepID=A0ABS8K6F2_9BURK|nr:ATP-binding protein [Paraburkholderia sp. MMS20-SJTR3]MCC8397683.1 response regulator [Paraburkholderia sp. MMS20-SJTR3]